MLWHAVDFVGMLSVFFTTFRWARAFVHSLRPNEEMKKTDGKSAKPPFNFGSFRAWLMCIIRREQPQSVGLPDAEIRWDCAHNRGRYPTYRTFFRPSRSSTSLVLQNSSTGPTLIFPADIGSLYVLKFYSEGLFGRSPAFARV